MPVAGLPVPLETVLTSWLTTRDSGTTVVVIRFREDESQPLFECHIKKGAWKRKTPSQRQRDQQRAEQDRAKGEPKAVVTLLAENIAENVLTTPIVSDADDARGPRAPTGTDHVAYSSVT